MAGGLDNLVERMVTALLQLLVTVVDRKSRGQAGSVVIPAGRFKGFGR